MPCMKALIVGASGPALGQKMVRAFLDKKCFNVFLLVTPESHKDERKMKTFHELEAQGAKLVEAALDDHVALQKVMEGIDVVLSLLGGPVIVSGQLALIEAARKAHVKRFIPSDYGFNLSKIKKGELWYYDDKITVQEAVLKSGLDYTFIAANVFTDYFYLPHNGFDIQNHRVEVWAPTDLPLSSTYSDDIAKLVPEVVLHPDSRNARVDLASHSATFEEIIAALEKATGHPFERIHVSEETIRERLQRAEGISKAVYACQLAYRRGDGTVLEPFNKVHPELASIKTISLEEFIHKLVNASK